VNFVQIQVGERDRTSCEDWQEVACHEKNAPKMAPDQFNPINSRYLFGMATQEAQVAAQFVDAPIIVPTNEARHCFNRKIIGARSNIHGDGDNDHTIRIDAKITHRSGLDDNTLRFIRQLGDEKTSRLPTLLYIQIGMPVMITFNQNVDLGVANGQLGTVVRVQFSPSTTWTVVPDPSLDNALVRVPSEMPEIIFVKLNKSTPGMRTNALTQLQTQLNLPENTVPILIEKARSDKLRLSAKRSITVSLEQFPLVPAFAITIHKIQGQTLTRAIIGSFRNNLSSIASFSAIYVALSRARRLDQLLLLEKFDSAIVRRCSIPMHLLDELKRLEALENRAATSL
jgi:hypothetical protein